MKKFDKTLFISYIDKMIDNVEKGPSGFWYDTEDCCGNPEIFDEIKKGIEKFKSVTLAHDICPWDRNVMYGRESGRVNSGCFHHCGLYDAKYLAPKILRSILKRFKERYLKGYYEGCNDFKLEKTLKALLKDSERKYIEKEKHLEPIRNREKRLKKAENAIKMLPNDNEWKEILGKYYGTNTILSDGLNFSRQFCKEIVGGENLTYDECLLIQWKSRKNKKHYAFEEMYYNGDWGSFKGKIDKISGGYICFNRIYIDGMRMDGIGFVNKEDHVWMEVKDFQGFKVGDCVEFYANINCYMKTSNGKSIDFGLENPTEIKKIDKYELPSDKQLFKQLASDIICENCLFTNHCDRMFCMKNQKKVNNLMDDMTNSLLNSKKQIGDN